MAKTLLNLRTQTRSLLGEPTATDWTNAELNLLINTYYHKVHSAVVNVFEDYAPLSTSNMTTVANQQEYSLPSDLLKLRRVEINYDVSNANSAPLRAFPMPMDSVRRDLGNTNLGVTILRNPFYFLRGSVVGFVPVPTRAGTDAIKVWYNPVLTDLSADTDTINIPYPDNYWMLIVYGATADALRFEQQESQEALQLEAKFERGIQQMQEELEDRVADETKFVTDTRGESLDFELNY